jgi:DNA uptake protein ComE-like DNA-binding protein
VSERAAPGAARAAFVLAAALGASALLPEHEALPCTRPAAAADGEVSCTGGAPLPDLARLVFGLRIDPNHADLWTLEALPGIGPGLAAAWVRERERAVFCTIRELDRVPGIGPSRVRGLAPWLEITPGRACGPAPERSISTGR